MACQSVHGWQRALLYLPHDCAGGSRAGAVKTRARSRPRDRCRSGQLLLAVDALLGRVMRRPPLRRMVRGPFSGWMMSRPTQLGRMMRWLLGMRGRCQHGRGEHSRQCERGQDGAKPTSVHIAGSPSPRYLQCLVARRGPSQTPLSHWLLRIHGEPEGCGLPARPLRQIPPSQFREAHCRLNRQCDPSAILAKLEVTSSITKPPARTRRCIMSPSSSPFVSFAFGEPGTSRSV